MLKKILLLIGLSASGFLQTPLPGPLKKSMVTSILALDAAQALCMNQLGKY